MSFLETELLSKNPEAAKKIDLQAWLLGDEIPSDAIVPKTKRFDIVETAAKSFAGSKAPADAIKKIPYEGWSTHEKLHFLRTIHSEKPFSHYAALDSALDLSNTKNSEVLNQWLTMCTLAKYKPCYPYVETFLKTIGRTKFLRPLYSALIESGQTDLAKRLFDESKSTYHPLSISAIKRLLPQR